MRTLSARFPIYVLVGLILFFSLKTYSEGVGEGVPFKSSIFEISPRASSNTGCSHCSKDDPTCVQRCPKKDQGLNFPPISTTEVPTGPTAPPEGEKKSPRPQADTNRDEVPPKTYIPCEMGRPSPGDEMRDIEKSKIIYASVLSEGNKWTLASKEGPKARDCAYVYIDDKGMPISLIVPHIKDLNGQTYNSRIFGSMMSGPGYLADKQYDLYPNGMAMALPCPLNETEATVWAWGLNRDGKQVKHHFVRKDGQVTHQQAQLLE